MIFNPDQERIIQEGVNHILYSSKQVYEYTGGPGTGKTEILKEIIRRSGIDPFRVAPMTYIGQAAIVLRLRGLWNAKTIHSWLYDCVEEIETDENGLPIMDPVYNVPKKHFVFIPRPLDDIDLMVIDEGYTVPLSMKQDIESRGKKIIVCGDRNQLPPVKDKPAYLTGSNISEVKQIMRQESGSYIITLSNMLLNGIEPPLGLHGNVLVIDEEDLTPWMLKNAPVVLCGTNKTRERYNNYIRSNIYGYHTELPCLGERVMCRKNNWFVNVDGINLTNGLTGSVITPPDVYTFSPKDKTFNIDFMSDLLNLQFTKLTCDYNYFTCKDKVEKEHLKSARMLNGNAFEFAYAKTVHLCQGSQYPSGIYISEYMHKDIQRQLDFTAVSRFMNSLIYVRKKHKTFY